MIGSIRRMLRAWERRDCFLALYVKDENHCHFALGRLTALGLADTCKRIYVQKEGPYYAACIEF